MPEQKLDIIINGQYKNINLKPRILKGIKGLEEGNYIIIEKVYVEGKMIETKFGKSYTCVAKYNGEQVSFFLNPKEHEAFKQLGGIGDKIKITLKKEPFINKMTGVEMIIPKLFFEKA